MGDARPRTSCARPAPSPTSRRSTTRAPSWRAIRANEIVNQFSEFGNYLAHWRCTGPALETRVRGAAQASRPDLTARRLRLRQRLGRHAGGRRLPQGPSTARSIAVVEAVECPTLLMNGYGEHNIQGIGDKHVPLIHNVMNTDLVDRRQRPGDRRPQRRVQHRRRAATTSRGGWAWRPSWRARSRYFGLSSIANVLGAIKMAKHCGLGPRRRDRHGGDRRPRDVCAASCARYLQRRHNRGELTPEVAAEIVGQHLARRRHRARARRHRSASGERIFNLGYFTWVEQQGIALADFDRRRAPGLLARPARRSCRSGTR